MGGRSMTALTGPQSGGDLVRVRAVAP